ncbi:MAG: cyclic nucleotide-binding domain-containing protein [Deltaproteobacteria bacterium]|nr:cyclic nucleotide-binding domain-containing protein [Deltaproteobacteria bacterium]
MPMVAAGNDLCKRLQKNFRFFSTLREEEVEDFMEFCDYRKKPAGTMIWREGDEDNSAAFIVSGRLGIKKKTEFEGKHVIVGTYGQGSVVGELCLLTDNARSVSAEIIEPAEIVILSNRNFEKLLSKHPMLGLKLLKHIFLTTSARLRRTYDRIASIF